MANSGEALFQRDITKAMSARGWEYVSWLELPHYRLIKREEEVCALKWPGRTAALPRSARWALASPTTPKSSALTR